MELQVYPKHVYEGIRRDIGVDYVRHELRKYLPGLRDKEAWEKIDADIATWFSDAPFLHPVRDFWNGVHGVMMGFKLYNQLLNFITAENVQWKRESISLSELSFGTVNPVVREVMPKGDSVSKAIVAYQGKDDLRTEHLKKVGEWYERSESRERHPIIVTQKKIEGEDKLVIYDGNGRTTMAILKEREDLLVYVGRFVGDGRRPKNFWLPTSVLMEVTGGAKLAWKEKRDDIYDGYVKVLKDMLKWSESGKYEMKNRVLLGKSEFKTKILKDLNLIG